MIENHSRRRRNDDGRWKREDAPGVVPTRSLDRPVKANRSTKKAPTTEREESRGRSELPLASNYAYHTSYIV